MSFAKSKRSFAAVAILAAFVGSLIFAVIPADAWPGPAVTIPQSVVAVPSAADVTNALSRPVDDTEETSTGATIGTTTVNAMAAKSDASFDEDVFQNFRIINTHGSNAICLKTVDRGASSSSCSSICGAVAAGTLTCAGAGAADGIWLPGGTTVPFTYSIRGTECLCAEASAASTTYQITRISRKPNH